MKRTENKNDCGEAKTKTWSGKNWGGGRRIEGEGKQKGLIERGKQNWRSEQKRIEGVKDGEKKNYRGG